MNVSAMSGYTDTGPKRKLHKINTQKKKNKYNKTSEFK